MGDLEWLPVQPRERFVDKRAVADFLGVSVSWVEKRSTNRDFPSHKVGGRRRFRLSEIQAWAERSAA